MEEPSDAVLVVAIVRFSQEALAEVYRRHAGTVFGLARRLLGEQALAEEVTQEVFLHLWRHPDRFDPERGALRAYLLSVTHARSVDVIRSEGARRRREEREARRAGDAPADVEEEALRVVSGGEVRSALRVLPEGERRAIELAYFGGHTYREVAGILGQPEGTVKSRIRAGLRRMRGVLAEAEMGG